MAYAVIQDLRNEGVSETEYSDAWCQYRLDLAQAYIERRLAPLFFERRNSQSFKFDGNGKQVMYLPVPPISDDSITEVTISDDVLDPDYYNVDADPDIPRIIRSGGYWPSGLRNIKITGDFGFVEWTTDEVPLAVTPKLIKQLTVQIAIYDLKKETENTSSKDDRIIEEEKGDYRYKLQELSTTGGDFGDKRIDNKFRLYSKILIMSL